MTHTTTITLLLALALLSHRGSAQGSAATASETVPAPVSSMPSALPVPNLAGQTGVLRVTSARPGPGGLIDLRLHGLGAYMPDFIGATVDETTWASGTAVIGASLFNVAELSLATRYSGTANHEYPAPVLSLGDLTPSLKVGFDLLPLAVGIDVQAGLPSSYSSLWPDVANFSVGGSLLLSLDLHDSYDLPLRAHVNAGYTYQNARHAADPAPYLLGGVDGQLVAFNSSSWFYDRVHGGMALEVPFPLVTLFAEGWWEYALGVNGTTEGGGDYGLTNSRLTVTPGVRLSVLPGVVVDVAADLGIFGTGAGASPGLAGLLPGQPLNAPWAAHVAVASTFDVFRPQQKVEHAATSSVLGAIEGCVTSAAAQTAIAGAQVDIGAGVLVLTDVRGCYRVPLERAGTHSLTISRAGYQTASVSVTTDEDGSARGDVALIAMARPEGRLRGTVTDARGQALSARLILEGGDLGESVIEVRDGVFDAKLPEGRYHLVVDAPGHFKQGSEFGIDATGRTVRSFALKPVPQRRLVQIDDQRLSVLVKIPFEAGNSRLLPAAAFILEDMVDLLLSEPRLGRLRVETMPASTDTEAIEQARARSNAIVDFLVSRGVPSHRLEAGVTAAESGSNAEIQFILFPGAKS
ncbi:MAG: carboxypeptidase regulatory-like domain-containing protein [Myxococcota bacterium]